MKEYWVVFVGKSVLFRKEEDNDCHLIFEDQLPQDIKRTTDIFRFHTSDGKTINVLQADEAPESSGYLCTGLRDSYYCLSEDEFILAGKSWELFYWNRHTRYCGFCGAATLPDTEISKKCPSCGEEYWPLLNVAVICLIYRGEEVLLVRARNFRSDFYGLVAGFVETGETLEDALRREVLEETSIKIKNIRYFDSQPWPYPCNLMVGFYAEYDSGDLHLQFSELERGGWFHRDHLPNLPQKSSIARRLIDNWLAKDCTP